MNIQKRILKFQNNHALHAREMFSNENLGKFFFEALQKSVQKILPELSSVEFSEHEKRNYFISEIKKALNLFPDSEIVNTHKERKEKTEQFINTMLDFLSPAPNLSEKPSAPPKDSIDHEEEDDKVQKEKYKGNIYESPFLSLYKRRAQKAANKLNSLENYQKNHLSSHHWQVFKDRFNKHLLENKILPSASANSDDELQENFLEKKKKHKKQLFYKNLDVDNFKKFKSDKQIIRQDLTLEENNDDVIIKNDGRVTAKSCGKFDFRFNQSDIDLSTAQQVVEHLAEKATATKKSTLEIYGCKGNLKAALNLALLAFASKAKDDSYKIEFSYDGTFQEIKNLLKQKDYKDYLTKKFPKIKKENLDEYLKIIKKIKSHLGQKPKKNTI